LQLAVQVVQGNIDARFNGRLAGRNIVQVSDDGPEIKGVFKSTLFRNSVALWKLSPI